MRKTTIALCVCALLVSLPAFARRWHRHYNRRKAAPAMQAAPATAKYGTAGCGLGSMAFGAQKGPIQIIAATLNGTSGNQTFGISSGTSNCKPDDGNSGQMAALFIKANRQALAKDISRGSGEALTNFSQIMGCHDTRALGMTLQKHYGAIFPSQKTSANSARAAIFRVIRSNHKLAESCSKIG